MTEDEAVRMAEQRYRKAMRDIEEHEKMLGIFPRIVGGLFAAVVVISLIIKLMGR